MADWFKFYENGLDEGRFQWAVHEQSGVCPVWLWILSECCKHKAGQFDWKGQDHELFGVAHKLNISAPIANLSIQLLCKIEYITISDGYLKVLRWNKFQSDYMRKLDKSTPYNIRTVSGQTPESVGLEERRGEERIRKEEVASIPHPLNLNPKKKERVMSPFVHSWMREFQKSNGNSYVYRSEKDEGSAEKFLSNSITVEMVLEVARKGWASKEEWTRSMSSSISSLNSNWNTIQAKFNKQNGQKIILRPSLDDLESKGIKT